MIIVTPVNRHFTIQVSHGEETVEFECRQLTYAQNSEIMSKSLILQNGQHNIDQSKRSYLNLQYGLVGIKGFQNEDGTPFELEFEDAEKSRVKESCLEGLLKTPVSYELLMAAAKMGNGIPGEITNPLTGEAVKGVKILIDEKSASKKKSSSSSATNSSKKSRTK